MPIQQVGQQPVRVLRVLRVRDRFRRQAIEQPCSRSFLAPLHLPDRVLRRTVFRGRPWHRSALRLELRAEAFQPVAQRLR